MVPVTVSMRCGTGAGTRSSEATPSGPSTTRTEDLGKGASEKEKARGLPE